MGEFVRLEVEDGVGTIRLDRPKMNAINDELTRDLAEATREATERDDVGAVVIWGGERIFAAGADVHMMIDMDPRQAKPMIAAMVTLGISSTWLKVSWSAAIIGLAWRGSMSIIMCTSAPAAKMRSPPQMTTAPTSSRSVAS